MKEVLTIFRAVMDLKITLMSVADTYVRTLSGNYVVYVSECGYVCTYVYMYVCMCVCMYVGM